MLSECRLQPSATVSAEQQAGRHLGIANHDHEVTSADELFVNLDGAVLENDGQRWTVEVCGIHSAGQRHWIQVTLNADDCCGVTVSTDRLAAANIRSVLADWLKSSSHLYDAARVVSAAHA